MLYSVMPRQYHTNIPASYLVLLRDSNILLLRRSNTGFWDGSYSLPAGHVESRESFSNAMVREAKEEIGVTLAPEDLRVAHVMHRKSDTDGSERVDAFFVVEKWEGEIVNMEPEKCDDLSWFSPDELPENIIPYIRHVLECIERKVFYSEYGW